MKNRLNILDAELQRKIEGLSPSQIRLMADIFAGLGIELSKTAAQKHGERKQKANARN